MNTANIVLTVFVVILAGAFVGMVTARVIATLIARSWQYTVGEKEVFVDDVTIACTILGAIGVGSAGYFGAALGLLYWIAETCFVPAIIAAVWGLVVAARWAINAGFPAQWPRCRVLG